MDTTADGHWQTDGQAENSIAPPPFVGGALKRIHPPWRVYHIRPLGYYGKT